MDTFHYVFFPYLMGYPLEATFIAIFPPDWVEENTFPEQVDGH